MSSWTNHIHEAIDNLGEEAELEILTQLRLHPSPQRYLEEAADIAESRGYPELSDALASAALLIWHRSESR
tara:strand:+ start:1496 stop:1708 length:213 start_codon:yes stop_codon:yes gene_type:complete